MKLLEIGKDLYINVDRIDGIMVNSMGRVKVYIGGSDNPWNIDETYANEFLEWIRGEGSKS